MRTGRSSLTALPCARAVTASEPFDRSGPVPAAVRAAGYVEEDEEDFDDEEEEEDEEEGSSVEETDSDGYEEATAHHQNGRRIANGGHHHHHHQQQQQHVEEERQHHQHRREEREAAPPAQPSQSYVDRRQQRASSTTNAASTGAPHLGATVDHAPAYSAPAQGSGFQVGAGGYAVEKKPDGNNGAGPSSSSAAHSRPVPNRASPDESRQSQRPPVQAQHSYREHTDDSSEEDDDGGDTEAETADEHVGEETPTAVGHFVEQLGGGGGGAEHAAQTAA